MLILCCHPQTMSSTMVPAFIVHAITYYNYCIMTISNFVNTNINRCKCTVPCAKILKNELLEQLGILSVMIHVMHTQDISKCFPESAE